MKRIILALVVVGVSCGTVLFVTRQKTPLPAAEVYPVDPPASQPAGEGIHAGKIAVVEPMPRPSPEIRSPAPVAPAPAIDESAVLRRMIDTLVSSESSYAQKEEIWKQLRDSGRLDEAIRELEQRRGAHPEAPEYPTILGVMYLLKIPTSQDARDPAILGLKSDQSFDAALKLDPSNWSAHYFKAFAMSYWPAEMNKGPEVIQRFQDLIQQQEGMSSQPQFAQSYALLGAQYEKAGDSASARQVWQRGATLFPNDETLRNRLAGRP